MGLFSPGEILARQIEYAGFVESFLAQGVNPLDASTWGLWTSDLRGYTVHVFVIGPNRIGLAAFPSTFEVQLDISEMDPELIDCLYLYRWDPSRSKYLRERSTDEQGQLAAWTLKRQLMKQYREYRCQLLAGSPP